MPIRPVLEVELDRTPDPLVKFRTWVERYTYSQLARSLMTNRERVHVWTSLHNRQYPTIERVKKIRLLSEEEPFGIGPLSYDDILGTPKATAKNYRFKGRTQERQILTRRVI